MCIRHLGPVSRHQSSVTRERGGVAVSGGLSPRGKALGAYRGAQCAPLPEAQCMLRAAIGRPYGVRGTGYGFVPIVSYSIDTLGASGTPPPTVDGVGFAKPQRPSSVTGLP